MSAGWKCDYLTVLVGWKNGRAIKRLIQPLGFERKNGQQIWVRSGFFTDECSVPRHPVAVYGFFGDKLHKQGTLHDYLFRDDSDPLVSFEEANQIFHEACEFRYPDEADDVTIHTMCKMIQLCGHGSYHKHSVKDNPLEIEEW